MVQVYLSKSKFELFKKMGEIEIVKARKKFYHKKLNHCKSASLNDFYQNHCEHNYNPILLDLNFHSHFSFYLYLFIKKQAVPYSLFSDDAVNTISQPINLNLTKVAILGGVSRNTIKKSFNELVKKGLILHTNISAPRRSNQPKIVMLLYDDIILGYEKLEDKVYFDFNK